MFTHKNLNLKIAVLTLLSIIPYGNSTMSLMGMALDKNVIDKMISTAAEAFTS